MRVLILCTGNSARSQMAEGLLRSMAEKNWTIRSAGTRPVGLNPVAVKAMQEIGIDISAQRSKPVTEFALQRFDTVITVCDSAAEECPIFPGGTKRVHWSLPDPAAAEGNNEQRLAAFRSVREQLAQHFREFIASQQ
jgi:arsenate reductase (thioredoxin)